MVHLVGVLETIGTPTALYGSESWVLNGREVRGREVFDAKGLRELSRGIKMRMNEEHVEIKSLSRKEWIKEP